VGLSGFSHEREASAQFGAHGPAVVAADVEAALRRRPVVSEGGDEQLAAFPYRSPGEVDLLPPVHRVGQEVKHGPFISHIEGADVLDPGNLVE
jgi:hypothetical protein